MNITSTSSLTMEEMTEASERIYNEVGDDADIIWGTVVDESLGDEMRVTVIATGIGIEGQPVMSKRRREPLNLMKNAGAVKKEAAPTGSRVSPIAAKKGQARALHKVVDYEEPTFMRKRDNTGQGPDMGYTGSNVDSEDLDIPTFLRRKAD